MLVVGLTEAAVALGSAVLTEQAELVAAREKQDQVTKTMMMTIQEVG